MIRMFARHPVKDFTAWKRAYDDFDEERRELGVLGQSVFQSSEDANDVTVWHDFESAQEAHAFAESPRLREVMDTAGVAAPPTIWFTRPVQI